MKNFKSLMILSLSLIAGCTNVASDLGRSIHPAPSSALNTDTLFSAASDFFAEVGYQCNTNYEPTSLHCSKALRDLYIHQTQAVVQIYPGDDEAHPHTLVTTRWDEGLLPGEFISSEFTNPDVKAFCEYLRAQALGLCRWQQFPA
ncbi:MAG: hypothetical protein COB25_006750 [Oceanospirillales bacterium]|nr:hypothetical protein [Oceanospirillales bacterium]